MNKKIIQRPQIQILVNRLAEPRRYIQILSGPRQVGKSSMIEQFLKLYKYAYVSVTADEQPNTDSNWLNSTWDLVRLKLKESNSSEVLLVIDEIQKVIDWSTAVKANWEKDNREGLKIKVILLGSSRLLIQEGLNESLMGRYELIYVPHWTYSEMHEAFGISPQQFAWFGAYPGAAELINDEQRWKNYVLNSLIEPSISKDILQLTRVDKPALLKSVFELASTYSSEILSYNKMLAQLQNAGNTTTLAHYLQLLDSAGLVGGLDKFSKTIIKQRLSSPKLQVHNTAFISALSKMTFQEAIARPDKWGRIIESVVGAHLLNHTREKGSKLYYWREANDEVDFVFEFKNKTIAIEVKTGDKKYTKGLSNFIKKFNPDKTFIVANNSLTWEEFIGLDLEVLI